MSSERNKLEAGLRRVIDLRRRLDGDAVLALQWRDLKHWQSERIRRTYPDLFCQPRYARAGEFFLREIYGARDFEQRDTEALRVVPKLARMLPDKAVATLAAAVELDELSEVLDARVAACLVGPISDDSYARAYVAAGSAAERQRQIDMVDQVGRSLERLARVPLLAGMLRMMRAPAHAAGLGHLHEFLESGFDAFSTMGPAREFLQTIRAREMDLMARLFGGAAQPLAGLSSLAAGGPVAPARA